MASTGQSSIAATTATPTSTVASPVISVTQQNFIPMVPPLSNTFVNAAPSTTTSLVENLINNNPSTTTAAGDISKIYEPQPLPQMVTSAAATNQQFNVPTDTYAYPQQQTQQLDNVSTTPSVPMYSMSQFTQSQPLMTPFPSTTVGQTEAQQRLNEAFMPAQQWSNVPQMQFPSDNNTFDMGQQQFQQVNSSYMQPQTYTSYPQAQPGQQIITTPITLQGFPPISVQTTVPEGGFKSTFSS